ncbi:TPA: hypothetical protein ACGBG5_003397 [Enterococcus faecalis]
MSSRIQEIALTEKNLGSKIKAAFKSERDIKVDGVKVRGRVFAASSEKQRDFEIFVLHLRNSQMLNGREEIKLIDPVARINVKRNNIGNSRSIDMVVYAKRLEVVGGNK